MRTRMYLGVGLLALGLGGFAALSLTRGQERPAPPTPPPDAGDRALVPAKPDRPAPDLADPNQKQKYLDVQGDVRRGAEWLAAVHRNDSQFLDAVLPAVRSWVAAGDYLRQLGATFALARAARFTRHEDYAAKATLSVLRFLDDTVSDPRDPQVRFAPLPSGPGERLAAAGLLVAAVHELPNPQADVLDKAEQLCNFIRGRQQADGSLGLADAPADPKAAPDPDAVNRYPGPALYALMRSQQRRPAAWKADVVRKALGYYRPWWRDHKGTELIPWQTAAFTEAYLLTKEQSFADFVFEMNDWLCGLQYHTLDPQRPQWWGGFRAWQDGQAKDVMPTVLSACCAEGLAEACRAARQAGDVHRHDSYKRALELGLQFIRQLQYIEANTLHFTAAYRPWLVGGFHFSHEDGNLRIDYSQHALSAMVQYLACVVQ